MTDSIGEEKIIVGLGNPGKDYEWTRHNLGFLVVRRLAEQHNINFGLSSFTNGLTAEGEIDNTRVCLLLPLTYMNNSGVAVKQALDKRQVPLANVIVVCDDFNLDFGNIRIRSKGSDGGHNGLSSIIEHLQTDAFNRIRLGIGQPVSKEATVDFVLEEFTKKEKSHLDAFIRQAVDCCLIWLKEGAERAMEQFNRKKENK